MYSQLLNQTIQTVPGLFEFPDYDYWAIRNEILPLAGDLKLSSDLVRTYSADVNGQAGFSVGQSILPNDVPLVDTSLKPINLPAAFFTAGAEWSIDTVERIRDSGDIDAVELNVMGIRQSVYKRAHEFILYGNSELQIPGIFNPSLSAIDESSTNVFSLSGASLRAWVTSVVTAYRQQNSAPTQDITLLVGTDLYEKLTQPLGTNDRTILQSLVDPLAGQMVKDVVSYPELDAANLQGAGVAAADKSAMLIGRFNPSYLRGHVYPFNVTPVFTKNTGIHFGVTGYMVATPIAYRQPKYFATVKFGVA